MTKLQKLIDERFIKRNRLATHLGVSPYTFQAWADGRIRIPGEDAVVLAKYFKVKVEDVLGEAESVTA